MARVSRLIWLLAASLFALLIADPSFAATENCSVVPNPPSGAYQLTTTPENGSGSAAGSGVTYASFQAAAYAVSRTTAVCGATFCTFQSWASNGVDPYSQPIWKGTWKRNDNGSTVTGGVKRLAGGSTTCSNRDCTASTVANVPFRVDYGNQSTTFVPDPTGCFDGCAAFLKNQSMKNVDGSTVTVTHIRYPTAGGDVRALYQYTGLTCIAEAAHTETPYDSEAQVANKYQPTARSGPNCGFVNGKYVCLDQLQPSKCWVNDDGSRICAEGAPVPPAPANPDGTGKAPADGSVQICTGTQCNSTFQIFNTTTVSSSGRPTSGGGDPSNNGGTGTSGTGPGSTPGTGSGSGTGNGGDTTGNSAGASWCNTPPTCTAVDPVECAQLQQTWRAMCPQDITAAQALSAIGATDAEKTGTGIGSTTDVGTLDSSGHWSGSCPAPITVTVMGRTMSMDIWQRGCDFASLFAPFVLGISYLIGGLLIVKGA